MKRTILCVCFDETVAAGRKVALEDAGYAVVTSVQPADALQRLASVGFDLLVIGHRFSAADKRRLATAAAATSTPVVLICGASADAEITATARVYALEGTMGLVAAVIRMLPVAAAATANVA